MTGEFWKVRVNYLRDNWDQEPYLEVSINGSISSGRINVQARYPRSAEEFYLVPVSIVERLMERES